MKIYQIALRNISRNKRRSLLSGTAVALAGLTIVLLFSLLAGLLSDMKENIWTYMSGALRIRHADFDRYERLNPLHLALPDYENLLEPIEAEEAVTAISLRINFPGLITFAPSENKERLSVRGLGVDFTREVSYQNFQKTLRKGRLPEDGKKEALIGLALAERLNRGIGEKITILARSGNRGSNAFTFTVVGLMDYPLTGLGRNQVQIPLDTAQRFLSLPHQVQEILIKVDEKIARPDVVVEVLRSLLQSPVDLSIQSYRQINGLAGMMDLAASIYDIIGIVFFLLAGTVILNTTTMVIFERLKEIGTLAALGMTGKQLRQLFFLESLFISIAGALVGIGVGIIITAYYSIVGFTGMEKAMETINSAGFSPVLYPVLNIKSTLVVFLYSVAVSTIITWWAARRVTKITPVEALRHV